MLCQPLCVCVCVCRHAPRHGNTVPPRVSVKPGVQSTDNPSPVREGGMREGRDERGEGRGGREEGLSPCSVLSEGEGRDG